jgi:hypothetical protein
MIYSLPAMLIIAYSNTMFVTDAPNTFLTPISLVRCVVVP